MSEIITQDTNNIKAYSKYTNSFKEKEIGTYLDSFLSQQVDKIISDLNNSYEKGDIKNCLLIIKTIHENNIFKIFSSEKRIILLDLVIKNILPNIICNPEIILNFLIKISFLIPKNYVIDWKFFYTFYYMLYTKNPSSINNYVPLFKSLYKFIPLNIVTKDDYIYLKKIFLENLYQPNKSYAINIFMYFLPKKYIEEDCDIQYKLFLLLKNCKKYFYGSCCMFAKILKKNGKLFFSEDKEKNDELIKIFLKYFFNNLNLYIIDDFSIKTPNYSSPVFFKSEKNKQKNKTDPAVIDTLLNIIFNTNLEKYNEIILSNLKLIVNYKHLYIKERSNTKVAKNFIKFITDFVHRLFNTIFYSKKYEEEINKKIKYEIKFNKPNEYLFTKLLDIIKIFSTCFTKLFLYENDGDFSCLEKLFKFIGKIDVNNNNSNYMETLVKNIDFNEYIKILKFFMENIETKNNKFILKLQSILPLLLSEYIYTNFTQVKEFIKEVIVLLSDSISSANISFDINILLMFATNFFDVKNKIKKNKIYEPLIPLIEEGTIKIMNNIIGFLDLICIKNINKFCFFVYSMEHFLDENNKKIISKKYADYIQNYEIESKYLKYYFYIIDKNEHEYIFNYVYNNMIYVDKSNDIKLSDYFLYNEKDEELKINVKYCSLEIFEKQINKYQNILSLLDYTKILTSEKNIKHFYEIYFTLLNKEEMNFKRFAIILFKSVLNSFINSRINEEDDKILIEYPSKENITLINNIYKKIILPYENYIKENLTKIEITKKFEQIIYIYFMLINIITTTKINIFLLLLEENTINFNEINIDYINSYKELYNLISNSKEIIKQIYEYKNGEILNNQNINSYFESIIINILKMNTDDMTNKRSDLKGKKSFIFNYFYLSHIKNYWLKQKMKVMNINYFSLLKNFISKNSFYYDCLYIFAKNITAVNQSGNGVSYCKKFLYSLNKEKIKEIYEKIYNDYKEELSKDKEEETETEKNKMKNILNYFIELSLVYLHFYPQNSFNVLIKFGNIFVFLKKNKYNFMEKFTGILFKIKTFIYLPECSEKDLKKFYDKYGKINDIIYNILSNIKINEKIKQENAIYYNIIKQILNYFVQILSDDNYFLNLFFNNKEKNDNNKNIINEREKMIAFIRLRDYMTQILDENDELYKKIKKIIIDIIFSKSEPISSKLGWLNFLKYFIKEEYKRYKTYHYIEFKNEDEFNKAWNDLKYKIKGKKKIKILPIYVDKIRFAEFNFTDENQKNSNLNEYKINPEEFMEILKQMDEWMDEKALMSSSNSKINEMIKKLSEFRQDNKGMDLKLIKTFYYMLELNYLNYNNDFIKNYKLEKTNNKILPVIFEFLLAKYIYMLNHKLFNSQTKKEFWSILNYYTNGANKKEDEKILGFFKFLFHICCLEDILFIFDKSDLDVKFPFDFRVKLYLYFSSFENLYQEKNIFENKNTEDIINTIITNDENLILYSSELYNILNVYFRMNKYLSYDFHTFEEIYKKEEIINFFINNIISKDFSKRSRYALYEMYLTFFDCLSDFSLFNLIIPKLALCANELKEESGNNIIQNIEEKFKRFNSPINFEILCEKISEILKKEENSNDANKLLYLQIVNIVYNSQKYFNSDVKFNSIEEDLFFKNLYKVFDKIKNENLKIKFISIFASFFNDLSEKENENFIKKYEQDIKNENYVYILMSQLLRFRMNLPLYIQEFIVKLKELCKKSNEIKSIINSILKIAMDNYHGTYIYMKNNLTQQCRDTLEEMTIEKSYFV